MPQSGRKVFVSDNGRFHFDFEEDERNYKRNLIESEERDVGAIVV
jgi:hypothetical protein